MGLICKAFGHTTQGENPKSPGAEYMECIPYTRDGMGTEHAYIKANCQRCGEKFDVGKIHIPECYLERGD